MVREQKYCKIHLNDLLTHSIPYLSSHSENKIVKLLLWTKLNAGCVGDRVRINKQIHAFPSHAVDMADVSKTTGLLYHYQAKQIWHKVDFLKTGPYATEYSVEKVQWDILLVELTSKLKN